MPLVFSFEVDGEMWCYQKPGFEALLLAELQRQQQCSQFCDTLLKAGGVSVPAHSCILSAISPHFSSALSSTPTPPSGQSRRLEFQALRACTLLHIIRLLYSGEMAGEGESEKQEAIYAAAQLGINGLVEVTKSRGRLGGGMEQYTEVGVQTEPLRMEEDEGRTVGWRREVRDGFTYLWKETPSDRGRDMGTQTEEQLVNSCTPAPPAVPYETIDISALQSLLQTDAQQFVPVPLVCPLDENQVVQCSSTSSKCLQESITSGSTSVAIVAPQRTPVCPPLPHFSTQAASSVADPQSCGADPNPKEWEGERLEQFEGNIAGFINYFLNPESSENFSRGRGRGERRPRGARGARIGQQRTRRPRGRTAGRGRGGFTQLVDVQEIGVGKLQKVFLHRWVVITPRTGQGGGTVGRKLYQKLREELEPAQKYQRRRGRGKVFEVDQSRDVQQGCDGGVTHTQRGRSNTTQQLTMASLFCSPSLPPMLSPPVPYVSPALSLHHTPQVPPPAPRPHEDQPEQIDRLLEEVMMGLDILPNNKSTHSQFPLPTSSNTVSSSGSSAVQNKQQIQIIRSGVPVLQQQCEGELNDMLENLLQLFEQHDESSNTRKEDETQEKSSSEASQPLTVLREDRRVKGHGETPRLQPQVNHSQTPGVERDDADLSNTRLQTQEASPCSAVSSENSEEKTIPPTKKPKKRMTSLFSLEKKKPSSQDPKATSVQDQTEQQLQQIPVVRLERNSLLSVRSALCQSPEEKSPSEAQTSSVKCSLWGHFGKNRVTKSYPIRSRLKEAQIKEFMPFLEQNLEKKADRPRRCRRGRPKKNENLLSSSHIESSPTLVQPQSMGFCCTNDQTDKKPEGHKEDLIKEVKGSTEIGIKRGAESMKETGDHVLLDKRICLDQTTTRETFAPSSQSADFLSAAATLEQEEVIDVETVSLSSSTGCLQEAKQVEEPISEAEGSLSGEDTQSPDEIIDVDGDQEDSAETIWYKEDHSPQKRCSVSPSHSDKEFGLEWTGKCDKDTEIEDIDVIGGLSPAPDPVIISWTESSEGEEEGREDEEVDVVGEKMDGTSSVTLSAVGQMEISQTEVLSY
ncbi:hypothetical protein AMECASPLE_007243 [Ameca splendens]|uniref:BTB domain-containing protein n=1 Tax=Ameca splendens TaxID=208324 RepID=A0ABV0YLQ7_9TELE